MLLALGLMVPATADARRVTKKTTSRLSATELLEQARTAFNAYDPDQAREKLEAARKAKGDVAGAADSLESRIDRMEQMIQRVEDIVVIDSVAVNREDFLSAYRISPSAGSLLGPGELNAGFGAAPHTAVYLAEDGSSMIWGTPEGLSESHRLTDGSWEPPTALGDVLNAGGTANYPFMLSDGVTLYYATEGDDSLGGLDLYISRRNRGEEFAVPQNMGMPYNSPFDDYMLAIDEATGAGWFATDRNQLGDSVTVYVFIPAQMRVNLDVDLPDLADRARLSSVKATQKPDADYSALRRKIAEAARAASEADDTPDFTFPLPDGRILTRWDDFASPKARRLMENYMDAQTEYADEAATLAKLRANYKPGQTKTATTILNLEKKLRQRRQNLRKLANRIVTEETTAK